ncbi:MAG: PIN domain-containing protein [Treponema sp.]|nr:PIN domain-containing protein [Candidatus Treponema equi]
MHLSVGSRRAESRWSRQYGKIKPQLKREGHPIPENDIWIAATAMSANLTLVTADSDFNVIKGLMVESLSKIN